MAQANCTFRDATSGIQLSVDVMVGEKSFNHESELTMFFISYSNRTGTDMSAGGNL
ncbi:hypothetical protein HDV02_005523, partial [Globomyces sp. JEL0801]